MRPAVERIRQADELEVARRGVPQLDPAHALHLQAEHHVLQRRQPRQKLGELKHHAAIVAAAPHLATVDRHLARRRGFEPHGDPQRRGLAAARRADERDDLAVLHAEVHATERLHGLQRAVDAQREPFRYVVQGHLTHSTSYREPSPLPTNSATRALSRRRILPRKTVFVKEMECRVKPGNDNRITGRCVPALPCGYRDKSAC
jgi:hypothetical protein